jgi:hypothetical protein
MSARNLLARLSVLSLAIPIVLLLAVSASAAPKKPAGGGSTTTSNAATMNLYFEVVDEQNLNAYYGTTGSCPGSRFVIDTSYFAGDMANGPTSAYGFGPPWTLSSSLSSSSYVDGANCNTSTRVCLGVKFNHNDTVLSLDTRGTLGPRKIDVNFSAPCLDCSLAGNPGVFGGSANVPALISVFLDNPFPSMAVCSSLACPEAQSGFAKLWFDDPNGDPLLTWRVDWPFVRVLRMSSNTWYVLGDGCDGSRVAQLYRLHNDKHRQSVSYQGSYLIPFFLSGVRH